MSYRILYLTDIHLSDRQPRSRKDNYFESICSKLVQTNEIAKEKNVDEILCGADLTHVPTESYRVFTWLNTYLKHAHVKWKTLIGQTHDFISDWNSNKEKTIMYALEQNGVLELLGQTYRNTYEGVKVFSSHETICPGSFWGHHTSWEDLKERDSVILCSHLHMPFDVQVINGNTFIAPGSIARNAADNFNLNRRPQVVYLEFNNGKFTYEFIPLKVELDIFDPKYILEKQQDKLKSKPDSLLAIESIQSTPGESMDVDALIRHTGSRFPTEALSEALMIKQRVENE